MSTTKQGEKSDNTKENFYEERHSYPYHELGRSALLPKVYLIAILNYQAVRH